MTMAMMMMNWNVLDEAEFEDKQSDPANKPTKRLDIVSLRMQNSNCKSVKISSKTLRRKVILPIPSKTIWLTWNSKGKRTSLKPQRKPKRKPKEVLSSLRSFF